MKSKRYAWVDITANYRPGGLPEDIDHVAKRSQRPDLITDPENLRGLTAAEHRLRHDKGIEPIPDLSLADAWHGINPVYADRTGTDNSVSEG
jgi:hypothetical protein